MLSAPGVHGAVHQQRTGCSSLALLQEETCEPSAQYFDKSLVLIKIIIMTVITTVAGSQAELLSGGRGEQGCEML